MEQALAKKDTSMLPETTRSQPDFLKKMFKKMKLEHFLPQKMPS